MTPDFEIFNTTVLSSPSGHPVVEIFCGLFGDFDACIQGLYNVYSRKAHFNHERGNDRGNGNHGNGPNS